MVGARWAEVGGGRSVRYLSGEKLVGLRMRFSRWCTSGPSFSESARACFQSGSAWNAAQARSRWARSS